MIRAVRGNQDSFRAVTFQPGFNVILADKTDKSTRKDSRNGVGKSLLLEIIHFCLGGQKGTSLKKPALKSSVFTLDLRLARHEFSATRALNHPGRILLSGDLSFVPPEIEAVAEAEGLTIRDSAWTRLLGQLTFNLPLADADEPFTPRFRSLFPFFARSGREAFADAFRHHRHTKVGEQQISNAFLLDLGWKYARQWQLLRERQALLKAYKSASEAGVARAFTGSLGELEAERVRVEQTAHATAENLGRFRVHPEYERIEAEASDLTSRIHAMTNENVVAGRLLGQYERSIAEEGLDPASSGNAEALERVYAEAGLALPGLVKKRIEDVRDFHQALVTGRRSFLAGEIERLKREIGQRKAEVVTLDAQRAQRLEILQTHGALAEYSRLQALHQDTVSRLAEIRRQIKELRDLEEGQSQLKIELETLRQTTRRDLDERAAACERAIALFNENSQALYDAPGNLIINVEKNGYQFAVEIERAGATGIENMKVFCYDLMLSQLWASRPQTPGSLIHDSPLFHGVDERQRALAWARACSESERLGFQYICMVNSDEIPPASVMGGFDLSRPDYQRIVLTDRPDGCLLGFRF
jgi:uncharacterized protein YydD (DUF2326 family)